MNILVTGGTGFVGNRLLHSLLKRMIPGREERIFTTGVASENELPDRVELLPNTDLSKLPKYLPRIDVLYHIAANNDTLCKDKEDMFQANVYEPIVLFQKVLELGCQRFVYASSTAVYGNQQAPYNEHTPTQPLNVYAESKLAFDHFAMNFAVKHKVRVNGLRYCNVYGPGELHKGRRMSMIGQMLRQALHGDELHLFKWGEQRRDWVYVDDVVSANILASVSYKSEIYPIGSGASWTFNQIVDEIKKRLPSTAVSFVDCPFVESYQNYTECDIRKASVELKYNPVYDLSKGIQAYLDYLTSFS